MSAAGIDDQILTRFRVALDALYGDRIKRVILFGSRARGDALEDSDYDVAVFLRDLSDYWREADRITDLATGILYEMGVVINALPFPAAAYEQRTALMREIRIDGVDL